MSYVRCASVVALSVAAIVGGFAAARANPVVAAGYFMDTATADCAQKTSCLLEYKAVPAGRTLIVTDVDCVFNTTNGAGLLVATLGKLDKDRVPDRALAVLEPVHVAVVGTGRWYELEGRSAFLIRGGEIPRASIGVYPASATFVPSCTVTGLLK